MPPDGQISAHLLGNMWAQQWGNIYPLLKPEGAGDRGYDLTQILKARNTDPKQMVKYGETFFTSLGFDALPPTFWDRSLFTKPADREVVCHASAWDIDYEKDVRFEVCIEINEEDFTTSITSWATILSDGLCRSAFFIATTVLTTDFMKPSATRWRFQSRRRISNRLV